VFTRALASIQRHSKTSLGGILPRLGKSRAQGEVTLFDSSHSKHGGNGYRFAKSEGKPISLFVEKPV
jgi:hypothetical protein